MLDNEKKKKNKQKSITNLVFKRWVIIFVYDYDYIYVFFFFFVCLRVTLRSVWSVFAHIE